MWMKCASWYVIGLVINAENDGQDERPQVAIQRQIPLFLVFNNININENVSETS